MCRILSLVVPFLLCSFAAQAQVSLNWTARYAGPTNAQDAPRAIAVDAAGNSYVAGTSDEAQVSDIITIKYNSTGAPVWTNRWGASSLFEYPTDIEIDPEGGVYVYGSEWLTNGQVLVLLKYDAAGTEQWVRRYSGLINNYPAQIALDLAGNNIYLTAIASQDNLSEFLTLKYDFDGALLWTRSYSTGGTIVEGDFAGAVAVNSSGQVYVNGVQFVQSAMSTFTLKYNGDGTFLWATTYPSSTYAQRIALDGSGNVYVGATTGSGVPSELLVLKYTPGGALLWSGTYGAPNQYSASLADMAVDASGNVYVAGMAFGLVTVKFAPDGTRQWVSRYHHQVADDTEVARGIAVDSARSVYVAGYTYGASTQHDFLALKYDPNGNQKWVFIHDEAGGPDFLYDFSLSPSAALFLTGSTDQLNTGSDILTLKLEQQAITGLPQIISGPQDTEVIAGQGDATFFVSVASSTPVTYQWRFNGRDIPDATQSSYTVTTPDPAEVGDYSVRVSNAVGATATPEARLTVRRPPTVTLYTSISNVVESRTVVISGWPDGDLPIRFQWRFNGADLVGQTNHQLRLTTVTTNQTGSYALVVRNPWGDSMSAPIQINVSPRTAIDRWTWRSPLPQGNELTDVAYGNGRYVAVGDDGTIVVSSNGRDWSVHTADYGNFRSIAFGDGLFAAAVDGLVYTSTDGITWTNRALPEFAYIRDIAFGAGRFVGVGNTLVGSDDGVGWIEHTVDPQAGHTAVTYGNGIFLVSAYNGTLISSNGIDWVHHPMSGGSPSLAAGNGVFVANGFPQLLISTNGVNWQAALTLTNNFDGVSFANGQFYALGPRLVTSTDGRTWTERMSQTQDGMRLTSAAGGPGQTVVVGDDGLIFLTTDGISFTQVGGGTRNNLRAIIHVNNRFTMVGNDGVIWSSIDGANFTEVTSPTTNNLRAIAFGNGNYVVVGDAGTALTSRDGLDWRTVNLITNDLYGIAFANGHFTAVGELGRVLVTTNVQDWTLTGAGTTRRLQGIAYGDGRYVATGTLGTHAVSTNAVHWTVRRSDSMGYLESIVYTNGLFVAVGANGRIFTSPDGVQWTRRETGSGWELENIIYVLGQFIAAGDAGNIMTSSNAVDWVQHRFLTRNSFRQIIYARGALWGVGNNEMIVKSAQLQPYVTLGPGPLSGRLVQVQAEPGQNIELQASDDLAIWETLARGPASADGTFTHIDRTQQSRRFYRVAPKK